MQDFLHNELCPACYQILPTMINEPGEFCVCFMCHEFLILTDDLKLRVMEKADFERIYEEIKKKNDYANLKPQDAEMMLALGGAFTKMMIKKRDNK
jgi:hypothetical protein